MDKILERLHDEFSLVRHFLGSGLTVLRQSNFSDKRALFEAFSSLSLGLERLMKLCYILNYHNSHSKFPNERNIKRLGHDLNKLMSRMREIDENMNISQIHLDIIDFLTRFSNFTRYSNINFVLSECHNDAIKDWSIIERKVYDLLPDITKRKICEYPKSYYNGCPIIALGYTNNNREEISSVDAISREVFSSDIINGYCTLYIIEIIESILTIFHHINKHPNNKYYIHEINRLFSVITYGKNHEKRKRKNFIRLY